MIVLYTRGIQKTFEIKLQGVTKLLSVAPQLATLSYSNLPVCFKLMLHDDAWVRGTSIRTGWGCSLNIVKRSHKRCKDTVWGAWIETRRYQIKYSHCGLRTIMRRPMVPNHEILGAPHLSLCEKSMFLSHPETKFIHLWQPRVPAFLKQHIIYL